MIQGRYTRVRRTMFTVAPAASLYVLVLGSQLSCTARSSTIGHNRGACVQGQPTVAATHQNANALGPNGAVARPCIDGRGLSQADAESLAMRFALHHRLVPEPVCAHTTREEPTGNWTVLFEWCYRLPDGTNVPRRIWTHLGRIITVTPEGYCFGEGADSRTEAGGCATRSALPTGAVDEKSAMLAARAFALAQGIVPSATTVESVAAADGSWLVMLVPGTRLPQHQATVAQVAPVLIRVDQGRECTLVYGRRGETPATQQATAQNAMSPGEGPDRF